VNEQLNLRAPCVWLNYVFSDIVMRETSQWKGKPFLLCTRLAPDDFRLLVDRT